MKLSVAGIIGSWTLIKKDDTQAKHWVCKCSCGVIKSVRAGSLSSGTSTGCGHARAQAVSKSVRTHGMTGTPEYRAWQQMKARVKREPEYLRKGITVCAQWVNSFENFYAEVGDKPEGKGISLGRPDNDGNYEPGNVRWENAIQQNSNKGDTVKITSAKFGTKTLTGWTGFLIEQTGSTAWTSARLRPFLEAADNDIDRVLQMFNITDLSAECARPSVLAEIISIDEYVPADEPEYELVAA